MLKSFIESTNFMVLIIAVAVTIIMGNMITACSTSDKELEYNFKKQQAKAAERQDLLKKGLPLAYIECINKISASNYTTICEPLKNK
jgi:hypothetical protein